MRTLIALLAATGLAAPAAEGLKKGNPEVRAISALAFRPSGVLFIGDPQAATITAVVTGDAQPGGKGDVTVAKLDEKVGDAQAAQVHEVKDGEKAGKKIVVLGQGPSRSRSTCSGPFGRRSRGRRSSGGSRSNDRPRLAARRNRARELARSAAPRGQTGATSPPARGS